jgi:hypothetical protein
MSDDSKSPLSKERRQEVFHALVRAQDGGANVEDSRRHTARLFDETCREFGVRYSEHVSVWAGLASHFRWLRRMGAPAGA